MTWPAATALAFLAATGCAATGGRSRTFDGTRLAADDGWIVAAPTPLVRQEGSQDCGAASLAMIAGHWHSPLSLDEAVAALAAPLVAAPATAARAPPGGPLTRLGDLRDVARARGLRAFAIAGDRDTLAHELSAGRPVLVGLHLRHGRRRARSHFEVVVAMNGRDDEFVTLDPARGWRVRSWADLDADWLPAGRPALVVVGVTAPAN